MLNILKIRELMVVGARVIVGGTFIIASLDKIAQPELFAKLVQNYQILPQEIVPLFSIILPYAELILGIFLLVGLFVRESAMAVAFLLVLFISAVIYKVAQGTVTECGCFSVTSVKANHSAFIILLRDFILLALCINIFMNSTPLYQKVMAND